MNYIKLYETTIKKNVLDYVLKSNTWFDRNGFKVLPIPYSLISNDKKIFKCMVNFSVSPAVFKMDPNTFYKFHVDETRLCTINLLLDGNDSHFYFGNETNNDEVIENIEELKYKENYYYLIDTTKKHAVLNFNNDRYLLSIGFNNHTFHELVEYFKNETSV